MVQLMSEFREAKKGKKHGTKNAETSPNSDTWGDATCILGEHEMVIDIDSLDKKVILKMIQFFNIKTQIVWTERGVHLYFKKPEVYYRGKDAVCPLGFKIEYKTAKNTKHGLVVKRNNEMRKIENEGVREDLPDIFKYKKNIVSLLGMEEGEGRNDALFKHRMRIADLSIWKNMMRFINNYILATPMDETELQSILRDGLKPVAEKDNHAEIVVYLINKYKIVSFGKMVYWKLDGEYTCEEEKTDRRLAEEFPLQKTFFYKEVKAQFDYLAPLIPNDKKFNIKLQNGILKDGRFYEIDCDEFTPYSISIPFIRDAETVDIVDDYINHLTNNDSDYRKLLLESLAHTLVIDKIFKRALAKFFIFVGNGGNGKGTLLFIIRKILDAKNCSALSIKDMTDERYFTTMQGKLCNLGDDVHDETINNEQMKKIKNISTCDYVTTRNLYKQSKDIELTTSLIFTSNHILSSFEKGDSYKRRLVYMPMYGKPKIKDRHFISKLTTDKALNYWMKLIVEAYERLYKNEGFTKCELVQKFNDEYHESNNTVLAYLKDFKKEDFIGKKSPEAYAQYEAWIEENGLRLQSRKLFVKSLEETFEGSFVLKKINGTVGRIFQ